MYNLLDEKWIPVLWTNGKYECVGIKTTLTQAHKIRQIAAANPMDRVAVIRFLLALMYWCKGNPSDGISCESFPEEWFKKLEENRECFELLGQGKRFYQYIIDGDKKLSVNYLVHEIPTGTNFWHFRHSRDNTDGLCLACCALGLIRLPAFSTSGGSGKPPGINSKPPIYAIPIGTNLTSTLQLSWCTENDDFGVPAWEQPDLELPKNGKVSLLTGLTWLPRRVWLDDPKGDDARCISCGQKSTLIRKTVFAPIGSTKVEGSVRLWHDPHVIYEVEKSLLNKGLKSELEGGALHAYDALGSKEAACGQWTTIVKDLFCEQPALVHPIHNIKKDIVMWVVGFATVKNNKYLETIDRQYSNASISKGTNFNLKIEAWQKGASSLGYKLKPKDRSNLKHPEIQSLVNNFRPGIEAKVEKNLSELMTGKDAAWELAAAEYDPLLKAAADSLAPGFTAGALKRRKQILEARPNIVQIQLQVPPKMTTPRRGNKK